MTSNANDEVFRSRFTAAVGLERAAMLLPLDPPVTAPPPSGIDLSAVAATVRPALAAIGAPARFGPAAAPGAAAFLDWQRQAAREGTTTGSSPAQSPRRASRYSPTIRTAISIIRPCATSCT
jgi:hypothetical protein